MALLILILSFVVVSRLYRRFLLPLPAEGASARVGIGHWILIAILAVVTSDFVTQTGTIVRAHARQAALDLARRDDEPRIASPPTPKTLTPLEERRDRLERELHRIGSRMLRLEAERAAHQERLRAARESGIPYEKAIDDPSLAGALEHLAAIHSKIDQLGNHRRELRSRWLHADRDLFPDPQPHLRPGATRPAGPSDLDRKAAEDDYRG